MRQKIGYFVWQVLSRVLVLIALFLLTPKLVLSAYRDSELKVCQLNASNPCINGVCVSNKSETLGYSCFCYDGYTGINCTNIFDECQHRNPCQNNAICINDAPNAKCICAEGYCGKYCENDVNECASNPCLNGGRCVDRVNGFRCECPIGYAGDRCEIDVIVCNQSLDQNSTNLCYNGGTCVDGPGDKYFCVCPVGYTGVRCESKVNACEPLPCVNGGRCSQKGINFHCTCDLGWTGMLCDERMSECETNICLNSGICMETRNETIIYGNISRADHTICYCRPDFHGKYCEKQYNECDPNPCLNDGICRDGIDSYVCACKIGFIGDECEINCSHPNQRRRCISPTTVFIDNNMLQTLTTMSRSFETISPQFSSFNNATQSSQLYSSSIPDYESSQINTTSFELIGTPSLSGIDVSTIALTSSFDSLSSSTLIVSLTASKTFAPDLTSSPAYELNVTRPTIIPPYPKQIIFRPRFNGINSSLVHYSRRYKRESIHIALNFETETNDGIIFYSKGKDNVELLLFMENSILKFYLSTNNRQILFSESGFVITQKSYNRIDIKVWKTINNELHCNISVIINNNHTGIMSTSQDFVLNTTHLCFDTFYFGELPINDKTNRSQILSNIVDKQFTGCLSDIQINGHEMLIGEAVKVSEISECSVSDICQQNPCRNGGTCKRDNSSTTSWWCACPPGFRDAFCHEPTCSDGLCENGGVCILQNAINYLCICSHGWYGTNCQLKMKRSSALFNGKREMHQSFIKYNLQNLTHHLEMRFRFATLNIYQNKALLLFMGHNRNYRKKFIIDFMSISLEKGYLVFRINLGHGMELLSTPLDSNITEQIVLFGHHKQFIWLIVVPPYNQKIEPIIGKTPLTFKSLNVLPYLYVGGHENFNTHPFLQSFTGFQGCIYDIELRSRQDANFQLLSDMSINKAVNIGECNLISDCGIE